ncbi:proline-rich protein 36 isoform X1 [Syngnathus typhle]|uniref:proline-rich protein 36 isoform X1 n=1 Tax=Syngnathus typhle TaxID=161592 RepID=UPI002A6988C9|nr:proline-rich protein 36 isoform X1 [Syngnathus typhle]XP_061149722.1 proline-rich protein 36 isoform X1 [Syngnathus typhle]
MVSKEPNLLLTGQTNGKSALAEKTGTMTVRSVLLNRDSPDIESRLRRRRNRTHQVRFKDLEDGSSSSGNSGTGENSHQRPTADCDSPHPLRKHGSRSPKGPWGDRDGPRTDSLPGQTSVVGAVRGDMASTIEVVAAFLARAPPHPLTPGPTRRCWAPPQSNSLTLPMTRKPSTSTAIQTSPCLKKSLSSTHTRSPSLGDSLGIDGDDEHDSQDEYLSHNHVALPGSKDLNGSQGPVDRTVLERRSKSSKTDVKSPVAVTKNSRHSCPPAVLHNTEPLHCPTASCRDGPKRQGSVTPSLVRRRKRLNRTTSDPGKEVHYCTTPTQTESPRPTTPHSNTRLFTSRVQTECTSARLKYCTTQSQTEGKQQSGVQIQNSDSNSTLPLNSTQRTTQIQTDSRLPSPPDRPPSQTQTSGLNASPHLLESSNSDPIQVESPRAPNGIHEPPSTQITTVPYCSSPPPTCAPTPGPEQCTEPSCAPSIKPASVPSQPSASLPVSCSAPTVIPQPISYYTHVTPPEFASVPLVRSAPLSAAPACATAKCGSTVSNMASSITLARLTPSPASNPGGAPCDPTHQTQPQATNLPPCSIVTQTALSCTSISYYTGSLHNSTTPSCTTLIQTVAHCNIPCQALQNTSSVNVGVVPYSAPVPKLTCTSPQPPVNLPNAHHCATPTKAVPLYSFRAAPPYTPPSQAPLNAQDKRGIRLPPPAPPPPPYTPRKKGNDPPAAAAVRPSVLSAESKANEKDKDEEKEKKEAVKGTDMPKLCERASSPKHRAKTPPVKGEKPSSPAKACFKPSCLSSAQAQLGVLHKMLCAGANASNSQHALPPNQQGCAVSGEKPLSPAQADTLRQVQEILGGLVSGARCKLDPARVTEKLLGPNGPLRDIRSLQHHLHSLEGVLETSQNTIKILLDVIQDLEKKEAERDGRHSYRTGQDIENCGTCRDCACIIYSVEHDFRLQEGQVVRTWKVGDPPEGSPQTSTPPSSTPSQQDSPQAVRPTAPTKKNRKKCFWFL